MASAHSDNVILETKGGDIEISQKIAFHMKLVRTALTENRAEKKIPLNLALKHANQIIQYICQISDSKDEKKQLDLNAMSTTDLIDLLAASNYLDVELDVDNKTTFPMCNIICAFLMSKIASIETDQIPNIFQSDYKSEHKPFTYTNPRISADDDKFVKDVTQRFTVHGSESASSSSVVNSVALSHNCIVVFKDHSFLVTNYQFSNVNGLKRTAIHTFEHINFNYNKPIVKYNLSSPPRQLEPNSTYVHLPDETDSKEGKDVLFAYMKVYPDKFLDEDEMKMLNKVYHPNTTYRQRMIYKTLSSFSSFPMDYMKTCLDYDLYEPPFRCLPVNIFTPLAEMYRKIAQAEDGEFTFDNCTVFDHYFLVIVNTVHSDSKEKSFGYLIDMLPPYNYWELPLYDHSIFYNKNYTHISILNDMTFAIVSTDYLCFNVFNIKDLQKSKHINTDVKVKQLQPRFHIILAPIYGDSDGNEMGSPFQHTSGGHIICASDGKCTAYSADDGKMTEIKLPESYEWVGAPYGTNNYFIVSGYKDGYLDFYIHDSYTLNLIAKIEHIVSELSAEKIIKAIHSRIYETVDHMSIFIKNPSTRVVTIINLYEARAGRTVFDEFKYESAAIPSVRVSDEEIKKHRRFDRFMAERSVNVLLEKCGYTLSMLSLPPYHSKMLISTQLKTTTHASTTILDPVSKKMYSAELPAQWISTMYPGIDSYVTVRFRLPQKYSFLYRYELGAMQFIKNWTNPDFLPRRARGGFPVLDRVLNTRGDVLVNIRHLRNSAKISKNARSAMLRYSSLTHRGAEVDNNGNIVIFV